MCRDGLQVCQKFAAVADVTVYFAASHIILRTKRPHISSRKEGHMSILIRLAKSR